MVWRCHTRQMCAPRSRLSSAGGSCGRQTAGHSSCRAQGPRSVGGTLPWLARPLGTASPSTCGLHRCPEIHLRKNLKLIYLAASALEVFCNWALYKLTYSFIHSYLTDLLQYHKSSVSTRSSTSLLAIPRHNLSFGSRSFRVSAQRIWNSLTPQIRQCQTLATFRCNSKTHYFQSAFSATQRPSSYAP